MILAFLCLGTFAARAQGTAPTITDFSPRQGPVGSTVVITGTNFGSPLAVIFGGNVSTAGSFTSTKITVNVPVGAQTGPIRVNSQGGSATTTTNFLVGFFKPTITGPTTADGALTKAFTYQISADGNPVNYSASGLPPGLSVNTTTGLISGTPTQAGTFPVAVSAVNSVGTGTANVTVAISSSPRSSFFTNQVALSNGVYYLDLSQGNPFGYYSYLADPSYIFHLDLGYEYVFDAADNNDGAFLYDFASNGFFYTSPSFPFPYLYDFTLFTTLYYYPDPSNPGRFNTNGVRYFYNFSTAQIISK